MAEYTTDELAEDLEDEKQLKRRSALLKGRLRSARRSRSGHPLQIKVCALH